ncbi:MFS transporter [Halomonas coralii]|nr:MFS transporter [Modicisalibacter sp. R2A 31.J]MBZ9573844.1 MFS transporter [Modicisalibacter sp. MOD 31.J]
MNHEIPGHDESSVSRGLVVAIVAFAAIAPAVLMAAPAIAAQLAQQLQLGPVRIGNLFSAELGVMSLATLPAYWWLPRCGWRGVALLAGLVFIAGNIASTLVDGYYGLMACRVVSALAGGTLMVLCISAASRLDNKDRVYGLWVLGQLVFGAVGLWLLPGLFERYGLAVAYWLLAGCMTLCLPLVRAFPRRPMTARRPADARSLPRLVFVLGVLAVLCFYVGLSGVWTFIGGIAADAGLAPAASGEVLSLATLLGIVGAGCATLIGNRRWRPALLVVGYLLMIAAIGLLYGTPAMPRFIVAALVFKFTWTFALPYILATLAELDDSGRLMSTINLVIGSGLALGPALAGRVIETSGGFDRLSLGAAGIVALSLLLILAVQRHVSVDRRAGLVTPSSQGDA